MPTKRGISNAPGDGGNNKFENLSVSPDILEQFRAQYDFILASEAKVAEARLAFLKKYEIEQDKYAKNKDKYDREALKEYAQKKQAQLNTFSRQEKLAYLKQTKQELNDYKKKIAQEKELLRIKKEQGEISEQQYNEQSEQLKEQTKELKKQTSKVNSELNTTQLKESISKSLSALGKSILNNLDPSQTVNEANSLILNYRGKVQARLQGSGKSWDNLAALSTTSISGYYQNKNLMQNLISLTEKGIVYNIEQRAFLQTISEKIADTFDAANGTLTRLIKIQQADTTASRLSLENVLTKFFNSTFKDNSYLSDNINESVNDILLGTLSSMSEKASVEFEYIIQKWFGSLYSVGFSSNSLSRIAQGLEYIGTGNVGAMSNDTALTTLFGLASSRAGLQYADLFTSGLSTTKVNSLLEGIVETLADINTNQNNILRSQWADIFGMSISDINALQNLSSANISDISNNFITYSDTINNLGRELTSGIASRASINELVSTMMENWSYNQGMNIANNPQLYTTYMVADMLEKMVGGLKIPTLYLGGFAIDLDTSISQLMKIGTGLGGSLGDLGKLFQGMDSIFGGKGIDATTLETIFKDLSNTSNIISTTPGGFRTDQLKSTARKSYIGSGSSEDISDSVMSSAAEKGTETGKANNVGLEEDRANTKYSVGEYDTDGYLMVNLAGGPLSEDKKSLLVTLSGNNSFSDLISFLRGNDFADTLANRFIAVSKVNNLGVTGKLELVAKQDVTATAITSISNDIDKAKIIDTEELQSSIRDAVAVALEQTTKRFNVNITGVGISSITNTLPVAVVGGTTGL